MNVDMTYSWIHIRESSENPNCYIHFSDGKNITVTLKEGIIVNDLLKDVASYHGVDNQV